MIPVLKKYLLYLYLFVIWYKTGNLQLLRFGKPSIKNWYAKDSNADPDHFYTETDPDPTFHCDTATHLDPTFHFDTDRSQKLYFSASRNSTKKWRNKL